MNIPSEPSPRAALEQRLGEILDHSLGSALLPSRGRKDIAGWRIDWPWMFLLAPALVISSLVVEYGDGTKDVKLEHLGWMQLWCVVFQITASGLAYRIQKMIGDTLRVEVIPSLSEASVGKVLAELETKFRRNGFRRVLLFFLLPWMAIVIPAMVLDAGSALRSWPFWSWVMVFVLVAVAASKAGYTSTFYPVLSNHSSLEELGEHLMAPEESPFVQGMLRIGGLLVFFMSYISVYLVTMLFWASRYPKFVAAHLTVATVLSLGIGIVTYARVYDQLKVLVARQRQRLMKTLEVRLSECISRGADESRYAPVQGALELLLKKQRSMGLAGMIKAALPILLQLGAVIVAALEVLKVS